MMHTILINDHKSEGAEWRCKKFHSFRRLRHGLQMRQNLASVHFAIVTEARLIGSGHVEICEQWRERFEPKDWPFAPNGFHSDFAN